MKQEERKIAALEAINEIRQSQVKELLEIIKTMSDLLEATIPNLTPPLE